MQTTTNYGFNIVEGTDIVNPLTQLNPNFTTLDTDLKAVSDNTIDNATCIKTGTVHAVTRVNTDANVFRFTATGNWDTGDTMTVDGTLVSVYLPDGTAPTTGCFVINTEVVASIQGTRVTIYCNQTTASNVVYGTSNVKSALDELYNNLFSAGGAIMIDHANYITVTMNSNGYITVFTTTSVGSDTIDIALNTGGTNLLRFTTENGAYQFGTVYAPKGATLYVKASAANIAGYFVTELV